MIVFKKEGNNNPDEDEIYKMPFTDSDSDRKEVITDKKRLAEIRKKKRQEEKKASSFNDKVIRDTSDSKNMMRSTNDKTADPNTSHLFPESADHKRGLNDVRELTTPEKHKIVMSIALIMIMSNIVFVQMGPFYPILVKQKGIDEIYVGLVFGTMATF